MASERQAPDAILAQTNLSGVVGDIQDDPDSPDANWLTAPGNNVNTDVRVSFPTPTGSPDVGADLQEFRAEVREFDTGQTGTPKARIELWENGSLVRAGSDTNVSGTSQVIAFTWNANELGTADGSLVECKVVGTKSGGSPSSRNTVEVGAVEWNVTFTAGTTFFETLSATAVAGSTMSGVPTYVETLAATATPLASLNLKMFVSLAATATAISTITKKMFETLSATAVGVATISGAKFVQQTLSATATPVSTISNLPTFVETLSSTTSALSTIVTDFIAGVTTGRLYWGRSKSSLHATWRWLHTKRRKRGL